MTSKNHFLNKNIDWASCLTYLKDIESDFRKDVFNTIFENFFPKKSKLITLDDCLDISESSRSWGGFYFFDNSGDVYLFENFIDEEINYVFLKWNNLRKEDREKLMYSKAKRRQLMKKDRELDQGYVMRFTRDKVFGRFSSNVETKMLSSYKTFNDDFEEDSLIEPFGCYEEISGCLDEKVVEESSKKPVDVFHKTRLSLRVENYPPRFNFGIDTNSAISKETKIKFDSVLDVLAKKYDLRHYCGKYVYEKNFEESKKGGMFLKIKKGEFVKAPYNHLFKPNYGEFLL